MPGKGRPFDPETARKAGQESARKRQERRQQREASSATGNASTGREGEGGVAGDGLATSGAASSAIPDGNVGILVPVPYVQIVQALSRAALAGDVSAARELRAWKAEHPEVDEHVDLEQQPAVLRDRLLRRLIAEEQAALDGQQESRPEQFQTPTDTPHSEGS